MVKDPKFKLYFLHPKFWLTWLGTAILYVISWLPFKFQIAMGKGLGRLLHKYFKKRKHIAQRNIELCFPEMPKTQQSALVLQSLENTGIAVFESGMAWWWPEWRVKRHHGDIKGFEHIKKAQESGKGVLLLVPHMLHLEMSGRMMGVSQNGVGFYRPHNNPLIEYFMTKGRLRSNEYLIGKKDVKGLLKALSKQKLCYYLPDQDYGRKRCEFVPFFAMTETATTTGTTLFASSKNCETIGFSSKRTTDGKYDIEITPIFENFPTDDSKTDLTKINQHIEYAINNAPEQYMWLHRRFKTRPDKNAPSVYK
ncbi:LpxL/LpxP family Kdo(2)-lipid IV(A) lauroyl/palmitoleoyl acyltransferase [Pseudoalteromonas denitrificans]|uniref:Lipid A biosynthesis acyltransferase n=1 Tax=Pseudoalteromonas denitrificans DSM 6059 TaxID=1123010 RepID=A0A1I1E454_9GAMM|nr:LpxL/LpxP family Kdo(2)-lipid IV(A) lauroyl/palmitoleoyl acyltransferase [Pseudoalteromonas denitrificans]SFB81951.1 KDO2-lipid IV(A) lauroyltransferase [Pseudoalteromonas denitrificans DSM 6059]